MVVVDWHSGQVHCILMQEAMNAEEHVQEYIRNVFRHFASKFLRAVYSTIGITLSMSTATIHKQMERRNAQTKRLSNISVHSAATNKTTG